jgi:protein arginine kinase activator
MICELCHERQATIHIQEIVGSEKKTLHICSHCAAEKKIDDSALNGFNLAEILYNLSAQMMQSAPKGQAAGAGGKGKAAAAGAPTLVCAACGWDSHRFRETGRLGCGACYAVYRELLGKALKSMHRGTFHLGKHPGTHEGTGGGRLLAETMRLQKDLEECVLREEYERAAELRDQINALREQAKGERGEAAP